MPRSLYRYRQRPLVLGTGAGAAAGLDPPPIRYITAKSGYVLVVYDIHFIYAEGADPPLGSESLALNFSFTFRRPGRLSSCHFILSILINFWY